MFANTFANINNLSAETKQMPMVSMYRALSVLQSNFPYESVGSQVFVFVCEIVISSVEKMEWNQKN